MLLHAIVERSRDAVYLDNAASRQAQPNENFAREVMELFTLGEGHYDERDIKEAARAFTGWSIEPDTGEFLVRPQMHDDGTKTVLGRSGNFDGDACSTSCSRSRRPRSSSSPSCGANSYRRRRTPRKSSASRRMFRDNALRGQGRAARAVDRGRVLCARRTAAALIKSPVDLVVGTMRQFRFEPSDFAPLLLACASSGRIRSLRPT